MTYDQSPSDQTPECLPLADLVEQLATDAAKGEFDKSAKSTLEEVAKGADKAQQDYARDTAFKEYVITWEKQEEKFKELRQRLKNCFPNWKYILEHHVCKKVIKPIRDTRQVLYHAPTDERLHPSCKYGPKVGFCETALIHRNYCLDQAKAQLDAWKDITGWIKKRLDENQALYDEICKLDKCEDYAVALYIFFFELWPAHRNLDPYNQPPPKTFEEEYCHGRLLWNCDLVGFPWLIAPDRYLDKLDEVACAWLRAGRAQAEAQAAFDQIAVLTKKLEEDDTAKARRDKATEELRNLKYGGDNDGDGGGQTPDPNPGPYVQPAPDPYPSSDPSYSQSS